MSENDYRNEKEGSAQHRHVHYHYHYHYPEPQIHQSRVSNYSQSEHPLPSKFSRRRPDNPQLRGSSSSLNEWKQHLNPEVTRMYDEFRTHNSRFSDNTPQINEEEEVPDVSSPRKSDVLYTALYTNSDKPNRYRSKLDELYLIRSQKKMKNQGQEEDLKSQVTGVTKPSEGEAEQKLRLYQKQLKRMGRYEQECGYLREQFYNHVVGRHPSQIEP